MTSNELGFPADPINPDHYRRFSIEPIDAIESWGLGFCDGAAVKYIARARWKGDRVTDLKKAIEYLRREVVQLERTTAKAAAPAPAAPVSVFCTCSPRGACYNCR